VLSDLIQGLFERGPWAAFVALIDVSALAYLIYHLIKVVRGTRAAPVFFGVSLVALMYVAAGWLGLTTLHYVIGAIAPYTPVAILILFPREIRSMLRRMALHLGSVVRVGKKPEHQYEDVVFAVSQLSAGKVGALIVIERETGLKTFVQSGVALDARLSADLLVSIFQRSTPLHDGGVIVQKQRIAAAACFLPLTTNLGPVASLGTRHRAAIGVTEESDAMALVVSETDGKISIATAGAIQRGVSLDRLRLEMVRLMGPVVSLPRGEPLTTGAIAEK
jgi:diadenylate cyclase